MNRPAEQFARACAMAAAGGDGAPGASMGHAGAETGCQGVPASEGCTDAPRAPKRIPRRRARGWRMPEGAVSVTRPGPWGNPFVVGRDGTAAECVHLYAALLAGSVCLTTKATPEAQEAARTHVFARVHELRGRDLACFCAEGAACHGDVLLRLANRPLAYEAT